DAVSDGKQYDFFRFHADAGQSITFEVLAQPFGSAFDAVVRILNEDGQPLRSIDDDVITPDSRFRHQFEKAGNYLLEIHDNRFTAGGRYRVRLGNFPLISFPYPPFVQRGSTSPVSFAGVDRTLLAAQDITAPSDPWKEYVNVTAHHSTGGSPGSATLRLSNAVQLLETEPNNKPAEANPIDQARGLNGLLEQPADRDCYKFVGVKDQTWRFAAKSRSFGSPTMLKMTLRNAAGEVVGKTAVGDADEWQFDSKFAADGDYVLEVEDLLKRGGPEHGYHIDVGPAPPFALSLKPDAKTRDRFSMQPTRGAAAFDLTVARSGYDGPIELRLEPPVPGLQIFNPTVAAGAKDAQIFLLSDASLDPKSLAAVRLIGKAKLAPEATVAASTAGLMVVRAPHVPYPHPWQDGQIAFAGVTDQPAFFEMTAPTDPISLPRSLADGSFDLTIKRVQAEFKDVVTLIKSEVPSGWSATPKLVKDTMSIAVKHPVTGVDTGTLKFLWYGVLNGRGQIVESTVKVRLFDPLKLTVSSLPQLKPGQSQKVAIEILREGGEPQPVTVKYANLPAGVTAAELTIAAAESKAEVTLTAAADTKPGKTTGITLTANTKLGDKEITAASAPLELEVMAP
ncbi:MAG: hypothetical protein IT423_16870, partial [Pirellulaceae bacterium]|nr:hypothetical protein [Pirellulaceae bacterium]